MVPNCVSARATATAVVSRGAALVSTAVASVASAAASAASAAWAAAKSAAYFCVGCVGNCEIKKALAS